jgi:serine protease AprX
MKREPLFLSGVTHDDQPLYKGNHNDGPSGSAHTARVTALRQGGSLNLNLRGQGMTVDMWEIGYPRKSHVEFGGRISDGDDGSFESGDANSDIAIHATHVAGTMIGSGSNSANARGIAYAAQLRAYDSENDDTEGLDAATNPAIGMLVSNHSYGLRYDLVVPANPWLPGAYSQESRTWDQITFAAPYWQPVIAAGNDRDPDDAPTARDFLLGNSTSKNPIIVAAVNALPQSGYNGPFTVGMSDFSSFGPTDDRRIKPDVSAKGVSVFSTSSQSNTAHATLQGTSMAAPAVAGVLILLQEHYKNLNAGQFMRAATVKGLVLNTADEAGDFDGPDYKFGWGLINAEKAAQMITVRNTQSIIDELTLNQGQTYTRNITAIGTKPLKATISWTDRAGTQNNGTPNSTTPVLVNDLNIIIKKEGQSDYMPWKLNPANIGGAAIKGNNNVDNVETVEIEDATGVYTIEITHSGGTLVGGLQNFSLIVDGVTDVTAGLSENELSNKIGIYPNPATDVINIAFDASLDTSNCSLVLYDIQGRVINQFNTFVDKIDVSNLSSGIYMLHVTKDGATTSKKIIIE